MARPDKTQAVEEITGRFQEADAALLTEYRGLTVSEIADLRSALRDADAEYKVLKNTLARLAVREVGLEELVDLLQGPTAIAFVKGDAAAAAKALDAAAKKYPVLVIKGGVLKGKIIDADQTRALADLEPREVQLAKIAMMLNAPLQKTVNVFAAPLRDLGSMLAQVVAKKESGELPGGAGAPAAEAQAPAAEPSDTAAGEEAPAADEPEEAPAADATDDTGDRGEAAASEAAAEATSATSDEVAEAAAPPEAQADQDSTDEDAAGGGKDKEE